MSMVMPGWETGIRWKTYVSPHIVMELTERCHYLIQSYLIGGALRMICQLHGTRPVDGKAAMQLKNIIARSPHATTKKSSQAR